MFRFVLLALLMAPVGNHWVKLKDSYRLHMYYANSYGNLIGSYYLPLKEAGAMYIAQCQFYAPAEFGTEFEAKHYVEACAE